MPQAAKETVDVTSLIKGILNGYPGSSAILREYLQNSDDAKANLQIFLLDEQSYATTTLVDPSLQDSQGSALIAMNDQVLSDRDWTALKKIHASSKTTDESQTGKNGLGFRASYHLTENPQILSGRTLMILDPHNKFEAFPGGVSIDIIDEGPNYQDQLAPFIPIMKDPHKFYQGTIFRLPLRTKDQAVHSRIKNEATAPSEIRQLLEGFGHNELEEAILFLKNISTIEIRHISSTGQEYFIGRATIDQRNTSLSSFFTRQVNCEASAGNLCSRTWRFSTCLTDKSTAAQIMSKRLGYSIGDELNKEKLVANVELAMPLGGPSIQGRLFTLLPLPIKTGFPLHFNAVFALTPDRQSLKNVEESGLPESRERRLVEWNRTVFEQFGPTAWVNILSGLTEPSEFWAAWPPEEHNKNSYWAKLILGIINNLITSKLSIFPLVSSNGPLSSTALNDDSILLAPPDPKVSLALLTRLRLSVVQPPAHIFNILTSDDVQISASVLSPTAVHKVLRSKYLNDSQFSVSQEDVTEAIKYLVFSATSPTIEYIFELPWLIHEDRSPATLSRWSSRPSYIVPTDDQVSKLFSSRPDMLSWDAMLPELRQYLAHQASLSIRTTNVILLTPDHVINYLREKFRQFNTSEAEVAAGPTVIDWLIRFWKWTMDWKESTAFISQHRAFHDLHLLPTGHQTIRKMSSQILVFKHVDKAAVVALTKLGIHALHSDLSENDSLLRLLVKNSFAVTPQTRSYIGFLADNFVIDKFIGLQAQDHFAIHQSLYEAQLAIKSTLSSSEKEKFSRLPIFHIRQDNGVSILAPVFGDRRILVNVDYDVPLPLFPGRPPIYVDVSTPRTQKLVEMVESSKVYNELDVLQLSIDNWSVQSPDLQEKFIERIFDNFSKISQPQLKTLPFVTVDNSNKLVPPCDLIDPLSPLSRLYADEKGKFPGGKFAKGNYLLTMRIYGFLKSQLDQGIISDRIKYLSNSSHSISTFEKAKALVEILDDNWKDAYGPIVIEARTITWLPFVCSKPLVAPSKSRDGHEGLNQHPHFYDLVWEVLAFTPLKSPGFRKALGWSDSVSTDVLLRQFSFALKTSSMKPRIITLITHLGQLHAKRMIPAEFLDDLRKIVHDEAWVPVSSRDPEAMSLTKYALLFETKLQSPFRQVHWRDISNDSIDFLSAMGCSSRPPLTTLYEELNRLLSSPAPSITVAITLLEEITQYADYDRAAVMVPSDDGCVCSLESIYYPDVPQPLLLSTSLSKSPIHRRISKGLAEQLKIPFLSAELLEQGVDEGDDEEQMAEDLRDRIEGFLRENDVLYAINEFFANADDAKATKFSILLDNRRDGFGPRVISPNFETLQSTPYIIFYNDALLSENDFSGLRKVGRGGKTNEIDTHGRHGLGALAFYYFTDIPFVISGEYVMILDPTSRYLPDIARSGQKRTSLRRKISSLVNQYPDQLKRFEGLFEFSTSSTFNGTMFCLPLNATIPRKSCDIFECRDLIRDSYKELAQNAFFFTTHLEEVSAREYTPSHRPIDSWSMSSARSEKFPLGDHYTRHEVSVTIRARDMAPIFQKWIVSTCQATIPDEHATTAANLKLLPNSKMTVQIALDPLKGKTNEEDSKSYLFSTLRLPKSNFLPFHLHARFAISSNRQTLIFTSGGSKNYAGDPKTAFNAWILRDIVPSLYLTTLGYFKHCSSHKHYDTRLWWLNPRQPADDITIFVREAIFKLLPSSPIRLLHSASEEWISFKDAVFSRDEPHIVCDILRRLRLPNFITAPRHTGLNEISSAMLVDAKYVNKAFTEYTSELEMTLKTVKKFTVSAVFEILHYIKDEAPLAGLPLFVLSDKSLAFLPRINEAPVYHSNIPSHCALFSSAAFLHSSCSDEIIQALTKDTSVNLQILSATSIAKLVEAEQQNFNDDQAMEEWINRFWEEYNGLPGPPPLSSLENHNLKLLKGVSSHLSLSDCQPNNVVQDPNIPWLVPILKKLDINVLKFHSHPELVNYINTRFPSLVINILQCFRSKNVFSFSILNEDEHGRLASWMRDTFRGETQNYPIEKQFLLGLPVWEVQLGGRQQLQSTSNLRVLPLGFDMGDIERYLRSNIPVASSHYHYSYSQLSECFKPLSPAQILDVVQLPTILRGHWDRRWYKNFVKAIITLVDVNTVNLSALKFPDCNDSLRAISELYNHSVRLFAEDLKYTERSSFLHPDFRDLSSAKLNILGFQHAINFTTFKKCAEAIETLVYNSNFLDNHHTRFELIEMAKVTFDCYNTILPSLLMTDASLWRQVDAIPFVRPRTVRRQGASYDVDPSYCTHLSQLLPPSQIIRPEFEPVAWSQCALPLMSLSEEVLAVNRNLGVPKASIVVEHLKVLATKVALRHSEDRTLLSDLKATYRWLNKNVEEAREALVCAIDIPLFLNVVDPLTSEWTGNWEPASKLILNLTEDSGTWKAVKPFLHEYEELLLSAGCHKLNLLNRTKRQPSTETLGVAVDLAKQFSEMRRENRLTDLFFEPIMQTADDDDESSDNQELAAHKVFLAATLPYFRDKFEVEKRGLLEDLMSSATEWNTVPPNDHHADDVGFAALLKQFLETTPQDKLFRSQKFRFEGTRFAAKIVLDFIYTGNFEYHPPTDNAKLTKLLDDFLSILSIADEWDMPSLKTQITTEIVENNRIIERLPHEFPTLLKAAELYRAEELEKYLKDFKEHNGMVLDILVPKES